MKTWETSFNADELHDSALVEDRRRMVRSTPVIDGTHLWLEGDQRVRVQVVDESEAGIGVLIPDMSFAIGPQVCVDYDQQRRTARVVYLSRQENGYRLGLEWAPAPNGQQS